MSRYLATLILSGIIPFVLSFYPPLGFYKHKKALALSIGLIVFIFGLWDCIAAYRGHWHFNPEAVYGLRILNLPVEEWLFFIVIPFCCIFTWEAINYCQSKFK